MKTILAFVLVLATLIGVGYWYYSDSQARLETLRTNNAQLESANRTNTETISRMQEDAMKMQAANEELNKAKQVAEKRVDKLRGVIAKAELESNALKDPNTVEEKINNGTQKVLQRLRDLTTVE
jgi:Tfp pilus assembly protein PilO